MQKPKPTLVNRTIKRVLALAGACALGTMALACAAGTPSPELVTARRTVARAEKSAASRLAPAYLVDAQRALGRAEGILADGEGSYAERHWAYIAQRRAQLAMAKARLEDARRQREQHVADYLSEQAQQRRLAQTRAESLQRANQDLQRQLEGSNRELQTIREQMEQPENDTELAELRAREAELVKERDALRAQLDEQQAEPTVITISGAVLFTTGESDLMPMAEDKLAEVAEVLKAQGEGRRIVIEGHTDNTGSAALNQRLSKARAESVRSFLIENGVDPGSVTARGMGEDEPVADNRTPEGRANNRRVEIIIENPQG